MNIQLYALKKSFEVQKAERFLKERRIPYQLVDLKKHRLGKRELELFARPHGVRALINLEDTAVKSHPIAYTTDADRMMEYLLEQPSFLRTPLIRDGNRVMVGFDEQMMLSWIKL
jgi:arsenate reductase